MSRSLAMSGKAMATKSLKEKWLSKVQSVREKGENGTGGSSTVTESIKMKVPKPWRCKAERTCLGSSVRFMQRGL